MIVQLASQSTPDLSEILADAEKGMRTHRGGSQLLATMKNGRSGTDYLEHLLQEGSLWTLNDDDVLIGFAIHRGELIEALFVAPHARRRGGATLMVRTILALENPPRDAYALPGDRAMKSIYESIGWKARLLTMRGD